MSSIPRCVTAFPPKHPNKTLTEGKLLHPALSKMEMKFKLISKQKICQHKKKQQNIISSFMIVALMHDG